MQAGDPTAVRAEMLLLRLQQQQDRNTNGWLSDLEARLARTPSGDLRRSLLLQALVVFSSNDRGEELSRFVRLLEEDIGQSASQYSLIAEAFRAYLPALTKGSYEQARMGLELIIEAAEAENNLRALVVARALHGLSLGLMGSFADALGDLTTTIGYGLPAEDAAILDLLIAWTSGYIHAEVDSTGMAIDDYDRAIDIAVRADLPVDLAVTLYTLGNVLLETGYRDLAIRYYDFYERFVISTESEWQITDAQYRLARINTRLGNYELSHTYALQVIDYFPEDSWFRAALHQEDALNLAKLGRLEEAKSRLQVIDDYFARNPAENIPQWRLTSEQARAEILLREGKPAEALRVLQDVYDALALRLQVQASRRMETVVREFGAGIRQRDRDVTETAARLREQELMLYGATIFALLLLMGIGLQVRAGRALRRSRDAAESASRHKTEFLANMSHEMRTPLNGIGGALTLLDDSVRDPDDRSILMVAETSFRTLNTIIGDLLDVIGLEAGEVKLRPRPTTVSEVGASVISLFDADADEKGLALTLTLGADAGRACLVDPERLHQILINLISNGIKYTPDGQVDLFVDVRDAGSKDDSRDAEKPLEIVCVVEDTGLGMPKHQQKLIFGRFERVHDASAGPIAGLGLGLAIVAQLVKALGGHLAVTSTPGEGSRFELVIPVAAATAIAEPARDRSEPRPVVDPNYRASRAGHFLVVEDIMLNQVLIVRMLEADGHRVTTADNGVQAVDAVRAALMSEALFDGIIMDLQMPQMNGIDATRVIRALNGVTGSLPIIALTANAYEETKKDCFAAGMTDFITKPINRAELRAALGEALVG